MSTHKGQGTGMSDQEFERLRLDNLCDAVDFFEQVKESSPQNQIAVGNDHWEWVLSAARQVVAVLREERQE